MVENLTLPSPFRFSSEQARSEALNWLGLRDAHLARQQVRRSSEDSTVLSVLLALHSYASPPSPIRDT